MFNYICAAFVIASFALSPIAQAEGGKIKLKGSNCYGSFQKFRCGYIGEVTIAEIYEKGWRVIAAVESQNIINLIIEEQEK